jgi:TRAP-type mannitol/chloroaromatic compound transport system substrate-binding protein
MKTKISAKACITFVALAVALMLVLQPQVAPAQDKFNLTFQATWPSGLTLYENFTHFAKRLDQMSAGRFKIKTLPAGAIVPAFEVLDATSKGVIDGAHAWGAYWVGKDKTAVLFTGGPGGTFGMDFIDYMGWMYEGGGLALYNEFYQKVLKMNVVVFPILAAGPQAFGWFKKPIKNLEDFKGMKCRETGMAAEVFTAMGMKTVNMPGGEILPAAERGVIDCAEWIGGEEDYRLGFHNIWKYYYSPGMHESTTVGELLINKDVWESLPPEFKAMVEVAVTEAFLRHWASFQRMNADAIKKMVEQHDVKILKTPEDILYEFLKTWDKIAAEESAKNPFFKKVLASQKSYASYVVPTKRFLFPPYSFAANYYWPEKK